jgi:tetratricopeptide (TPR) repeat protein
VAWARKDYDRARSRYEEAMPLYRRVGGVMGEANCLQGLGDIALRQKKYDQAGGFFRQALALYERIPEPLSMGWTHRNLARLPQSGAERLQHVDAARTCWAKIDRQDLIKELEQEFKLGTKTASG